MTDKQKNKIRKWQHYKFWKKQVVELNSTLDLVGGTNPVGNMGG